MVHTAPALVGAWGAVPHHEVEARVGAPPGDLVDLVTPFAFLGAAALVLWSLRAGRGAVALAVAAAIFYVDGHGMHLAANSIAADPILPHTSADRAYFYDERLGHIEWHLGWLGLMAAFVVAERLRTAIGRPALLATAALLAPILAVVSIEGQTWWLVVAAAPCFCVAAFRRRGHVATACAVSVALAAIGIGLWALVWQGVPQLTEVV